MKKLLSALLVLAMAVFAMPQMSMASALEDAPGAPTRTAALDLRGGALAALAAEREVKLSGGVYASEAQGWSYDAKEKTLTLSGAHVAAPAGDTSCGIFLPAGAKLVLAEGTENIVKGGYASAGPSFGVFCDGNLSIEGGGALVAEGGSASEGSFGIHSFGGSIDIAGGAVTAAGGNAANESAGILAVMDPNGCGGAVGISGGFVTATGGTARGSSGITARGDNATGGAQIRISGGEIEALGGASSEYQAFGICARFGSVTISGASGQGIRATAGASESVSYGIYADANMEEGEGEGRSENDGKITINGGDVTAIGGKAGSSYGIFATGAVAIRECAVNATGGTSFNVGTTGIASESGGITINGAATTVNAVGGTAKLAPQYAEQGGYANSMGLYALGGDVLIEGDAVVYAGGGASQSECLCGIHLNKGFQDGSGGRLTIRGNARVKAVGGIIVNMRTEFGGAQFLVGGNAKVDVSAPDATQGDVIGISLTNGHMALRENAAVTVHAGNAQYGSYGVRIDSDAESARGKAGENDGRLTMAGGTLEARSSTARNSRAVFAQGDIEISGGALVAQSGTVTEEASTGVFSNAKIHIGGTADVTAKSGPAPSLSAALYANGGVALDSAVSVLSPKGGAVSADGSHITAAAGEDSGCADEVRISAASAEDDAQQEPGGGEDEGRGPGDGNAWLPWAVLAAAALCAAGVTAAVMRRKKRGV